MDSSEVPRLSSVISCSPVDVPALCWNMPPGVCKSTRPAAITLEQGGGGTSAAHTWQCTCGLGPGSSWRTHTATGRWGSWRLMGSIPSAASGTEPVCGLVCAWRWVEKFTERGRGKAAEGPLSTHTLHTQELWSDTNPSIGHTSSQNRFGCGFPDLNRARKLRLRAFGSQRAREAHQALARTPGRDVETETIVPGLL